MMGLSNISLRPALCAPQEEQEAEVYFIPRTVVVALGAIAVLAGILVFCDVPGISSLGTIGGSVLIAGGAAIGFTSFCIRCVKEKEQSLPEMPLRLTDHTTTLVLDFEELGIKDVIIELCGMSPDGSPLECSSARAKEIVDFLVTEGKIKGLNAMPKDLTPLQYWAMKGNLEVVKLLVEHDALDFCIGCSKSALYMATRYGHPEVVDYLLSEGATPNIGFEDDNVLYSFLPVLIYEWHQKIPIPRGQERLLMSLRKVLEALQKSDPENLKLQLQTPIYSTWNVCSWIRERPLDWGQNNLMFSYHEFLKLLKEFGAGSQALSVKDLEKAGYDVGTGETLADRYYFKR